MRIYAALGVAVVQALKFCGAGELAGQMIRLVGEFRESATLFLYGQLSRTLVPTR